MAEMVICLFLSFIIHGWFVGVLIQTCGCGHKLLHALFLLAPPFVYPWTHPFNYVTLL